MINWSQILYGVALTAVGEAVLTVAVPRWRRPALVANGGRGGRRWRCSAGRPCCT
jgi:hypothetical protein